MGGLLGVLSPLAGRRDWLFAGFLAVALTITAFVVAQRIRYRRAIMIFATCAADANTECASTALETLRAVDADNVRTSIAQAQLRVLGGEADAITPILRRFATPSESSAADRASTRSRGVQVVVVGAVAPAPLGDVDPEALAKLDSAVRGDLLLLSGDVAVLRGDARRADARWTEAAAIVGDTLVAPRRQRLAARADARDASVFTELDRLQEEFRKLFDQARSGSDGASYAANALRARVRGIGPALAAQKLGLAVDAAERCANMVRMRRSSENRPTAGQWRRPDPPVPPSADDLAKRPWMRGQYDRQKAQYEQTLARWESQEADKSRAQSYAESELATSANAILGEAESLLGEGLSLARANGGPIPP